jgi:hypothetical protein
MKWILALTFLLIGLATGLSLSFLIADHQRDTFIKSHEVFCSDCCWKTEYFYTCTKEKNELWKRIKP